MDYSKKSLQIWDDARKDMFSSQGPLNSFKPFSDKNRKTKSTFKKHIKEMIEVANESFVSKKAKGLPALEFEAEGHRLFNDLQETNLLLKRKTEENKRQKEETAARKAQMRDINKEQGLVPPIPVPQNDPVQQASAQQVIRQQQEAMRLYTPRQSVQQSTQGAVQTPVQQASSQPPIRQPANRQQQIQQNQPVHTPRANGNVVSATRNSSSARPAQRRRTNPTRQSNLYFEEDLLSDEENNDENGVRVPHNEAPATRHRDMIDRIDRGNTITNRAMTELSNVLKSDRRSENLNNTLNNVVNLINATGANNDVYFKNTINRAFLMANKMMDDADIPNNNIGN